MYQQEQKGTGNHRYANVLQPRAAPRLEKQIRQQASETDRQRIRTQVTKDMLLCHHISHHSETEDRVSVGTTCLPAPKPLEQPEGNQNQRNCYGKKTLSKIVLYPLDHVCGQRYADGEITQVKLELEKVRQLAMQLEPD